MAQVHHLFEEDFNVFDNTADAEHELEEVGYGLDPLEILIRLEEARARVTVLEMVAKREPLRLRRTSK